MNQESSPRWHANQARVAEDAGDWKLAASHWFAAGYPNDGKACEMVSFSSELGDAYREYTAHVAPDAPEPFGQFVRNYKGGDVFRKLGDQCQFGAA